MIYGNDLIRECLDNVYVIIDLIDFYFGYCKFRLLLLFLGDIEVNVF